VELKEHEAGRSVELRDLVAFVAVASHLHFSRAAADLHLSQPALSRTIRRLEERVGVRLLERSTRNVALTSAGEIFLAEARLALQHANAAVRDARAVGREPQRSLVVGYSPFCRRTASELISAAADSVRGLTIAHRQEYGVWLLEALERDEIDLAITIAGSAAPGLATQPLRDVRLACMVAHDHPLADRPSISLSELRSYPFADPLPKTPGWQNQLDALFREAGFTPEMVETGDPLGEVRDDYLVSAPGVVWLQTIESVASGSAVVVPIVPPVTTRWELVWNPAATNPAARDFRELAWELGRSAGWLAR